MTVLSGAVFYHPQILAYPQSNLLTLILPSVME